MIRLNFAVAFRNIRKSAFFTTVNILGLGIGLASCLVIFEFLQDQWSYDKFHKDYDNIYRVHHTSTGGDAVVTSATTFSAVADELKNGYSFTEATVRLHRVSASVVVEHEGNIFREQNIMGADSSFFDVFNFQFKYGSPELALKAPGSIVITKSLAEKYFGDKNPVGDKLILTGAYGYWGANGYQRRVGHTIGGVIEDLPINTHFDFDILVSFNLYPNLENELRNWGSSLYTYFRVQSGTEPVAMNKALGEIVEKYQPDEKITLNAQKAQEIYLTSNLVDEVGRNGSEKLNWLLAVVAFIILVVAGTNYVNFSTAQAIQLQKEVGIRKIFFANRRHLFQQLIIEALLLNLFAILFAFVLVISASSFIQEFTGFNIIERLQSVMFWLTTFGVLIASTLISGLYPAILFSKAQPKHVISNLGNKGVSQGGIRKSLLIMQFTISSLVIGFTVILYFQMQYMEKKELGINITNTLVINGPVVGRDRDSTYYAKLQNFKLEALAQSDLKSVVLANFIPGKEIRGDASGYVRRIGDPVETASSYYFTQIDYDFMNEFNFRLLAGRFFDESYGADGQALIINSQAARQLGFLTPESAIGQKIHWRRNRTPTIIGVVDDYHQHSLQRSYQPIVFEVRKIPDVFCYIKYEGNKDLAALETISGLWEDIFPGNPFSYFFLDDFYSRQYSQDLKFTKVFGLFTFMAILIASLGIIGLTYFTATKLVKEIGIRKTLGAGYWDVLVILGKGLGIYVVLASVISIPMIYLLSENWLINYAFRIDITWWLLVIPILLLALISFLVVLVQSVQSFKMNPISALRVN